MIAMGRALLADLGLPNKTKRGALEDINPCIYCNRCEMATSDNVHVRCTVNPKLGNERQYIIEPTRKPRRTIVVGGGPAGMVAATQAAFRGNDVTLFEKQTKLGGQLVLAAAPPYKDEISPLIDYLEAQLRKSGTNIMLGEEATYQSLIKLQPEVVIIATGAQQIVPKIEGIDKPNVVYAWDVLRGDVKTGNKVVVIGGGMVGLETAEYLAEKGCDVQVIEMLPEVGQDMEPFSKIFLLERFQDARATPAQVAYPFVVGDMSEQQNLKLMHQ